MKGEEAAPRRISRDVYFRKDATMFRLAIALLVIALIAALLGFGGMAGSFVWLAKIVFLVFLVLAVFSFLGHGFRKGNV